MSRGSGLLAYFACARQPLALAPLPWGGRLSNVLGRQFPKHRNLVLMLVPAVRRSSA